VKTIKELLCLTERECFEYVKSELKVPYEATKNYIITRAHYTICPLICVHLDTVSDLPPTKGMIVEKNRVLSLRKNSIAKCLGADDRAGVWIALEMLRLGTKTDFEYGFFCGEERGGKGSQEFALDSDLEGNYSCFIGLDRGSRGGIQNVAEYGMDNKDLLKCFTDQGFLASSGTFTDCSNLAMECELACVNVSVGYISEHSSKEMLYLDLMEDTLKVMRTVEVTAEVYKADERPVYNFRHSWEEGAVCCDMCGLHSKLYNSQEGYQVCGDCLETVVF